MLRAFSACYDEPTTGHIVSRDVFVGMRFSFFAKTLSTATLVGLCASVCAESHNELVAKGDVFDTKLNAEEALQCYLPAEKLQPRNAQVLIRIARQYRHLMADAPAREEKLRLGGIALDYARRAAALTPNDSEAQLSIAISYGKMLPLMGVKEQMEASRHIKETADRAIRLNPHNDLAWHVLGRWHRVLSDVSLLKRSVASLAYGKLPQTTTEEAVKCFEKAIEINPNRLIHYIELGRAYAQMRRVAEARRFIEKGLAMPDAEKDDPDTKRRGRETLAKLR